MACEHKYVHLETLKQKGERPSFGISPARDWKRTDLFYCEKCLVKKETTMRSDGWEKKAILVLRKVIIMAKAIKTFIIAFFTAFFTKWLEDFFILSAIALIIANTYLISVLNLNILIGNYVLAVFLAIIGLVLARR